MKLHEIVKEVSEGNFQCAYNTSYFLNQVAKDVLNSTDQEVREKKMYALESLIQISDLVYNNSTSAFLPLSDDVYDKLVVMLLRIDPERFHPGAKPMPVYDENHILDQSTVSLIKPFMYTKEEDLKNNLFTDLLKADVSYSISAYKPFMCNNASILTKRMRDTPHNYPNLVGTLMKCKYVLNKQAEDKGVLDDSNVSIFERDYLAPLLMKGVINYQQKIEMIASLKYDGISIEADVSDHIVSARTRGDTGENLASDLTPIFEGYEFPKAKEAGITDVIGMKFEAIIMKDHLALLNQMMGTNYINARTAIIGITGSSQAAKYKNFITLVPLQADFGDLNIHLSREEELIFINKYYANREGIRWAKLTGDPSQLLFLIKKFTDEAETYREFFNFMYDGIVVEFADESLRKSLGRKNSINQYAMAIKFNPLSKITIFKGFTYTVGQNGVVVPMLHYEPVDFMGSIHTKCSASSYERFKKLDLYIGDEIQLTYVNDVIPYVDKLETEYNTQNHKRPKTEAEEFPEYCPCCGSKLEISDYAKSAYCTNMNCSARVVQRLTNMLAKLDIKDFSQAAVEALGVKSFKQLMTMSIEDFSVLGPSNKIKLYENLHSRMKNVPDYKLIGALGFSNIASKKWKLIFSNISLVDLYTLYMNEFHHDEPMVTNKGQLSYHYMKELLSRIKGVGKNTAEVICNEMEYFKPDIEYIITDIPYTATRLGLNTEIEIRLSGFRDPALVSAINRFDGVSCDEDAGVTRSTNILIVPYMGYNSGKVERARKYGVTIVEVKEFVENTSKYIPGLELED